MKKINTAFLVSLLLCAVLWVGSQPIMAPTAVAQNVEIDTSQPPVVVNSSSNLGTLTVHDGRIIIIRTGSASGLMYYAAGSSATVDDVDVINGPGGVGRYLRLAGGSGAAALADVANKVADVTALLATSPSDNQLYQTLGYSTEGVGANLYRYDAASSATIDGGFVLPGPGGTLSFSGTTFNGDVGTGGRFIAVDQTVAIDNVFGSVNDGSTDDFSAIQRAIATGKRMIATGVSKIASDLTLTTDGQIIEFSDTAVWKPSSGVGTTWISVNAASVTFDNVRLDGSLLSSYDIQKVVSVLNSKEAFTWKGGYLKNFEGTTTYLWGVYFLVSDSSVDVNHVFDGITFASLSSTDNTTVGDNAGSVRAILGSCSGTPTGNPTISIRNCAFDDMPSAEDTDAVAITGTSMDVKTFVKVYNNRFRDIGKRAIKIQVNGAEVYNNRIFGNVNNASELPAAAINVSADNCHIHDNMIEGYFSSGIDLNGSNLAVQLFFDYAGTSDGLSVTGGSRLISENNRISCERYAIVATDYTDIEVNGDSYECQYGVRLVYTDGSNKTANIKVRDVSVAARTQQSTTVTPVSLLLASNSNATDITLTNIHITGCHAYARTGSLVETDTAAGKCSLTNVVFKDNTDWGTATAYTYRIDGDLTNATLQVTRIGAHTGEVLRVANDATDVIIGGCYLPASFTTTASLQDVFGTSTRVTADIAEQYTFGS